MRYKRLEITYGEQSLEGIAERLGEIRKENPKITDMEAKIFEVISRMRGENGLSDNSITYLTACIMKVIEEEKNHE